MITLQEINKEMGELNGWALTGSSIEKSFSFGNFKEAIAFVNSVGEVAEAENHHPDIMISYDHVRLSLTTHSEKGLSKKDFEVAKEIDKL